MKKIILLSILFCYANLLAHASSHAKPSASTNQTLDPNAQMCMKEIQINKEQNYTPPKGWHLSYREVDPRTSEKNLFFFLAVYNFDHKIGENQNRISCYYQDRHSFLRFEITTDKTGYVRPTKGNWKILDNQSSICTSGNKIDPSECAWE